MEHITLFSSFIYGAFPKAWICVSSRIESQMND